MKEEKVKNSDFIRQISKKTGYAQVDVGAVLNAASEVIVENLADGKSTSVFKGMVIYPSAYNGSGFGREISARFPRARFGKFFRSF